jgi:hypothetical protein
MSLRAVVLVVTIEMGVGKIAYALIGFRYCDA